MRSIKEICKILDVFKAKDANPGTELEYKNAFTLLVAIVLSVQSTDKGVNKATGALFSVADTPQKMLALGEEKLKEYIRSVNLYPTKAKRILETSKILLERVGGEVPADRDALESLPGVGRKTHILRVSRRLGLSRNTTPRGVEEDLMQKIPEEYLRDAHHLLLLHGRYVCKARNPQCANCVAADICPKNPDAGSGQPQ